MCTTINLDWGRLRGLLRHLKWLPPPSDSYVLKTSVKPVFEEFYAMCLSWFSEFFKLTDRSWPCFPVLEDCGGQISVGWVGVCLLVPPDLTMPVYLGLEVSEVGLVLLFWAPCKTVLGMTPREHCVGLFGRLSLVLVARIGVQSMGEKSTLFSDGKHGSIIDYEAILPQLPCYIYTCF